MKILIATCRRVRLRGKVVFAIGLPVVMVLGVFLIRREIQQFSNYVTPVPFSDVISINPRAEAIGWTFVPRADLGQDDDYFHPKKEKINPYHVKFVLPGASICGKGPPYLLVIIPLLAHNRKSRDLIRETWGSVAKTRRWPRRAVNAEVKIMFLLGKNSSEIEKVREESLNNNDIVMADFVDSYRNLSRKIITGLFWVEKFCPDARYILKCDDDTFVHIPLLVDFLLVIEKSVQSSNSVIGYIHGKSKVRRSGIWKVPSSFHPLEFVPTYASGSAYILPRDLALRVLHVSEIIPLLPVEDAYITGVLTRAANGTHIHSKMFTRFGEKGPRPCEFLDDKRIACTQATDVLKNIWKSFVTNTCGDLQFNISRTQ